VGEGSGLGLDIARRIVRTRHKGEIRFESRPGETTFEVRLPIPCEGAAAV
jgi:nitrogen-specific signal transduction histidine kinase